MIKEFAIEPSVMATWRHFQALWDDFGVGRGRLISTFPILWKSRVDELAKTLSKPVQASAISAKIRRDEHKFLSTGRTYRGEKSWLENAVSHRAADPFDAIIAEMNPGGESLVLVADDLDKGDALYRVECQGRVQRTAGSLRDCAKALLRWSDEILLVDPHFDPTAPRFQKPLKAFLDERPPGRNWKRCELHTLRHEESGKQANRMHNFQHYLQRLVPASTTLQVHFWSERPGGQNMHARFLLTELGGIQFDHGLDEGDGPEDTTIVTLMEHDLWQSVRADFSQPSPSFDITADCIVAIPGRG